MADIEIRNRPNGFSEWMKNNWRSLAFMTYFAICAMDFLIMPAVYAAMGSVDITTFVQLSLQYKDPNVQIEFLKIYAPKMWTPITMLGAGSFHIAYGAILTAAGYTRGQAEVARINQSNVST